MTEELFGRGWLVRRLRLRSSTPRYLERQRPAALRPPKTTTLKTSNLRSITRDSGNSQHAAKVGCKLAEREKNVSYVLDDR